MKYKGNIIFILLIILASFAVAASYFWNIKAAKEKTNDIVKKQSAAFFLEIVTARQWNAGYGGVYVPVTEDIQPNPYLDIPDRDVYTTDSIFLTKINPAFMTRLISEIAAKKNGIKYHITSLKLTNPDNKADEWETKALKSFEKGKKEDFKFFEKDSSFRYMAPLMVTNACMKCHEKDGYKVGDVRGGISVTAPGKELVNVLDKQKTSILLAHILIFFTFLAFIIIVWVLNYKQFLKIRKNNELLSGFNKELELMQKESETLNAELITKSLETEQAKSEVEKYNAELLLQQEATEKLNQEIFAKSIETEQAKYEIERFNKELILQQEATEKLSQEIFAKSLETEQAKLELEKTTEKIRTQAVIAEILTNVSGKQRNIENFLQNALEKILNVYWLDVMSKGSIFLTDEDGNLKMVVEKDLGEVAQRCALIKPGECLCGRVLSEKKIQFCDHISDKHDIKFDNMSEHGHYNLPIMMEDEVLGVINIYTSHKHQKKDFEIEFLETVADTLASVIHRKKSQDEILRTRDELNKQKEDLENKNKAIRKYMVQIEQQTHERESLNQLILAQKKNVEKQKEEVEQRNAEIEKYSNELEEQAKEQEKLNQELFAQKMEVEQRNMEVEQYSNELEDKAKEQDKLNQQLFAQKMEVEQRNMELEQYSHKVEELKEKAEGTLKHLNDSINYSKYIQDSLLPEKEYMDDVIPSDYFIYYKPKETIGGDFYYVKKVNDYIIFAVADCTGHGVPGALITMLGLTFLDDIITGNIVTRTGMGLTVLREKFKNTFKAYGDNITNKNGLDIGLCAINTKTNILQFSGAFNNIYVFRNKELIELKGTRNPIGYYPVEKDFETQELKLEKDDMIYLFSDGYPDQLGGEKGRKFSKRQFRGLLAEIHSLPVSQQKVYVEKIMEKWMGNISQVDDITLMGVKWSL